METNQHAQEPDQPGVPTCHGCFSSAQPLATHVRRPKGPSPSRSACNGPYPYTSPLKTDRPVYDSLAMVEPLPTFEQVLEPMQSPKPPIACRVVELDGGSVRRTATVLFDGLQGWYIDDGARVEVRSSDESVLFDSVLTCR